MISTAEAALEPVESEWKWPDSRKLPVGFVSAFWDFYFFLVRHEFLSSTRRCESRVEESLVQKMSCDGSDGKCCKPKRK